MPLRRSLLLAALLSPFLLGGCDTITNLPPKYAQIRFANYAVGVAGYDFLVDGTVLASGVPPETVTSYSELDPVQHSFATRITGTSAELNAANYTLNGDTHYTMVAYGTAGVPSAVVLVDPANGPGSGTFRARVVQFAPDVAALDLYVTDPAADLEGVAPNVSGLAYGGIGDFDNYTAGTFRIRAALSGTKDVIYDSGAVNLPSDANASLIAYSRGSGRLVNLAMVQTTGTAPTTTLESTLARVRALNIGNATGPINVLANQSVLFPGLADGAASLYATLAPAGYDFGVEATSAPGAVLAALRRALVPATDTSLYFQGNPGAQSIVALDDDNTPALTGGGRLRIVNAAGNGATIDVLANDAVIASGVTPTTAPFYVELAVGRYTLTVRDSATLAVLAPSTDYVSATSTVSTLYVAGTTAQTTLVLVLDR